jgi:hypothetical protein
MFGFCFSPTIGSGNFTIHNNTTDWSVTKFVVTAGKLASLSDGTSSHPADTASASTSRSLWSASSDHVPVDPIVTPICPTPDSCLGDLVTYGAYEAVFTYTGSDNDILPGESDGDFFWQRTLPFGLGMDTDASYVIFLAGIGNDTSGVCTGSLSSLGTFGIPNLVPGVSTCEAPSLAVTASAPEPGALALLGSGLVGFSLSRRRKRRVA